MDVHTGNTQAHKPAKTILTVWALALLVSSCTFTMEGNIEKKPAQDDEASSVKHYQKTVNATSYSKQEKMITLCKRTDHHVARVRFHTNAGFIFASIFSLGFYVPQHVEWWCGPLTKEVDEEPFVLDEGDDEGVTDE
jgi:hypothetical protein